MKKIAAIALGGAFTLMVGSAFAESRPNSLIQQWSAFDSQCATDAGACGKREDVARQIVQAGWCRDGDTGWKACASQPTRVGVPPQGRMGGKARCNWAVSS